MAKRNRTSRRKKNKTRSKNPVAGKKKSREDPTARAFRPIESILLPALIALIQACA